MGSFFGCRLLSLGLDMGVLWLGIEILRMNDMLVKILSNILVIIVNYIASKFFIFKKNRQKPEMEKNPNVMRNKIDNTRYTKSGIKENI